MRTNGRVDPFESNGLSDLQQAVGGDIEVCMSGSNWTLWANGMGRIMQLPMNQVAREFVAEVSGCRIEQVVSLHGDFVLVGCDSEGSDCDVPEEIAMIAKGKEMFTEPITVIETQNEDGTINRDVFV